MKKYLIILISVLVSGSIYVMFNINSGVKADNDIMSPNDWFFRQRAFPTGQIPHDIYMKAMKQRQEMKKQAASKDEKIWEFAGPTNIGGRISDVEMYEDDMQTIFIGAASGGVFKSDNAGNTWTPIFDEALSLSIGDIAPAPSNKDIIYVGTGEANAGGGSLAYDGVGVYKSIDGGDSWVYIGLPESGSIGRMVVSPDNPDILYVATMGSLFGNSPDRGVYRTQDGGETWENVLFVSDSTGAIDLVINPGNPDILYAAMWERVRRPDRRSYGGPTCGIYKTENGGDSWTELSGGLPMSNNGRIGIDISKSNPNILYAIYADKTGYFKGIYKTQNGGDTWIQADDGSIQYQSYGWWFGRIKVDPVNPDIAYAIAFTLYKTTNGGINWSDVSGYSVHVDQHEIYIHPENNNFLVLGNDGGLYVSQNGGNTWSKKNTLPVTQFYTSEIDNQYPQRLYGGTQDNGTNRTMTGNSGGWESIYGGDGFYVLVDPENNNYVYAESQYGGFGRSTDGGNSFSYALNGISGSDRFNWNTPVVFDPANPQILYFGTNKVYKSTNRAVSWTAISGDLSNGPGGGNLTFGTVTTLAVSPVNPDIVYAGTDDGNVWVKSGSNWTKISDELPVRWVTRVAADPHDENTAFVTISGYRYNEYLPHVFRTTDLGQTWTDISGNLPEVPVNDIIIDPEYDSVLYIATDAGAYYTRNLGANWDVMGTNLPNVVVCDFTLHNDTRKLVAATFGRSMYSYDLNQDTIFTSAKPYVADLNTGSVRVYPNPFKSYVKISFENRNAINGNIKIYDLAGRRVATLYEGEFKSGLNEFRWRPVNSIENIFFVKITAGGKSVTKKIIYDK
jgi:photosystem II stability/assembly factor-like uncharacterized protein